MPLKRGTLTHIDRLSMLLWMMGAEHMLKRRPMGFSKRIENEIVRIRKKLREPERTIQAIRLVQRYIDARDLAVILMNARNTVHGLERIQRLMSELSGEEQI